MADIRPHNENSIILQQSVTSCHVSTKCLRGSSETPCLARLQLCSVSHTILHQDGAPTDWGFADGTYEDEQSDRHSTWPPRVPGHKSHCSSSCGVVPRALFTNHQLPEMMTLRSVSRMRPWLFMLTYSSERGSVI